MNGPDSLIREFWGYARGRESSSSDIRIFASSRERTLRSPTEVSKSSRHSLLDKHDSMDEAHHGETQGSRRAKHLRSITCIEAEFQQKSKRLTNMGHPGFEEVAVEALACFIYFKYVVCQPADLRI